MTMKTAPRHSTERTSAQPSFPHPYTTVDLVIFSVIDEALCILLVKRPDDPVEPFPNHWALPGGFVDVDRDTTLEACARRKLVEKTNVVSPYLEQLGSWGGQARDPRGWSATHVYFALIPGRALPLAKGANAADVGWFAVDNAQGFPQLAFDHAEIVAAAIERLRGKVEYTSLPAFLIEAPFSLPQLQRIYEIVLGRPLDKSGFRTRMLSAGFLVEAGYIDSGSKRPSVGYRLKDQSGAIVFPRTFGR